MGQNYIVFHNERSTRSQQFDELVVNPLQTYLAKYEGHATYYMVKPKFDDTMKYVAKLVRDGDTVIAAGGDGTLSAVFNGLVKSGKSVDLIIMPLGKCDDLIASLGGREKFSDLAKLIKTPGQEYYALEALINDRYFYWALHEWGVGHLANIGVWLDEKSRAAKIEGKKFSTLPIAFNYYRQRAIPWPDADLPTYTDEHGREQKHSAIQFMLGRIGGAWWPRVDGKLTKSLHSVNGLAVVTANITGRPLVDVPTIINWTLRGLPARRVKFARFTFAKPIKKINVMVDGENFNVKNMRSLSTRRVATKVKLHLLK